MKGEKNGKVTINYARMREVLEQEAKKWQPIEDWSEGDEQLLREFYGKMPPQEIARILKRTRPAIMQKAQRMGLTANRFFKRVEK